MAKAAGVSQPTVSRVWRAFGLKLHLIQYYTILNDPSFGDKTRGVVGIHINLLEAVVVLCVDEKTRIGSLPTPLPVV
nr:hypothetical protein [Ferrimicrobium acidiphilum]